MFHFGKKLANIRCNARRRKIPFNLNVTDLKNQWKSQEGVCALSKQPFEYTIKDNTPSVDRIDSYKGYVPENIQFVQLWINRAKGQLTDEEIIDRIKKIK